MTAPLRRAQVPAYRGFATLADMAEQRRGAIACGAAQLISLGESQEGRPIDMLSMGQGDAEILVVGTPHPNEAVGTRTIEFLIQLLCNQPSLLPAARWHFISAIEPDGVVLNEPWYSGQLTPESYWSSFYRPALPRQAEYTFPYDRGGNRFVAATPENRAWQAALEQTRPRLLVSLHNCEAGGVFYFTSAGRPDLDQQLADMTRVQGFALNNVGERDSLPKPGQSGIFAFPDEVQLSIDEARTFPNIPGTGDSSAGFAGRHYGSFSLIPEVPYWSVRARPKPASVDWPMLEHSQRQLAYAVIEAFGVPRDAREDDRLQALQAVLTQPAEPSETPEDVLLLGRQPALLLTLLQLRPGMVEASCAAREQISLLAEAVRASFLIEPYEVADLVYLQAEAIRLCAQGLVST